MKETPARHTDGFINEDILKQLVYNEKMAELGRISAGVVHELNAPLSVIVSASQMILREDAVTDFVREMVERIGSEAQRLSQLTRGLLNFSRHEEAVHELDVNITIDFILDFLRYEAARRGVSLLRVLDYHLPVISMDGNVLKQVMLNIIMNALQAMESAGGTLQVESSLRNGNELHITVSDTGPGIPEESLGRIFDPYFTTKKVGEGTGLGLFVTKELVEDAGGRIEVSSTVDQGTTFELIFPITGQHE